MKRSKENQEAQLAIDRKADILKAWLLCKRVRIQYWACALRKIANFSKNGGIRTNGSRLPCSFIDIFRFQQEKVRS